jgi:hypothetical protein
VAISKDPYLVRKFREEFERLKSGKKNGFDLRKRVFFCAVDDCYSVFSLLKGDFNCAVFSFTNRKINKLLSNRVDVFVVDHSQKTNYYKYVGHSDFNVVFLDCNRLMHAKFCVSEKEVIFGSANFTKNGFERNDEFIVFSDDPSVVRSFRTFFERILKCG